MTLDSEFRVAAESVRNLRTTPSEDEMLEIYALYKQATVGDCDKPRPGIFDMKGRFKWDAWNKNRGMDQDTAKKQYIQYAEGLISRYGVNMSC